MKWYRVVALLKKEFGQLFKDKKLLPLVFVAPVLQLTLLGFAASVDVKNIAVVLCDLDKTSESRALAEKFVTSGYFTIEFATDDYKAVGSYLDDNKASMALVIPRQFGDNILKKQPAKIQVLVDGSEGNTAAIGVSYVSQIVSQYSNRILTETIGMNKPPGGINAEVRAWYNPDLRSRNYMIPAVLVLILLVTTMNLTSMAVVREKEIGTLEQIMVTPIRPTELIIGKLIPFTIVGSMNATVVMLVMVYGYGVPIKGNVFLLASLAGFFLLTTLGLGLFVSTITRTQQQAMMVGQFFILQPMMYLSGFTFPVENMPVPLQVISWGIPMRHFLVVVRSLVLKGVGFADLWLQALLLLGMGAAVLGASVLRFHKKLD
jgi:ABC-2 type transport system permease protein